MTKPFDSGQILVSIFQTKAKAVLDILTIPIWLGAGLIYSTFFSRTDNPWIISGHRGRIKADNTKSLFNYIVENTDQELKWALEKKQFDKESVSENFVERNSWSARIAILKAPVLIYSHGEDDIDILLRFIRPIVGQRVYIGHGVNLLKRPGLFLAGRRLQGVWKNIFQWLAGLDYDHLLTMSSDEKANWDAIFPDRTEMHLPYGGAARIDNLRAASGHPAQKTIAWLPTFRESHGAQEQLRQQIATVINDIDLLHWLDTYDYTFFVGNHINSPINTAELAHECSRVKFAGPADWVDVLAKSELLISDYSSILIDWLLFDRPAVFAPFDLNHYSAVRGFHETYDNYIYGPVATAPVELVEMICNESWKNNAEHGKRRTSLREQFFGGLAPDQAALTYRTIKKITGSE
jgi:CDP-glycerol glycerophosphotransferase (TagB/SpsB family)